MTLIKIKLIQICQEKNIVTKFLDDNHGNVEENNSIKSSKNLNNPTLHSSIISQRDKEPNKIEENSKNINIETKENLKIIKEGKDIFINYDENIDEKCYNLNNKENLSRSFYNLKS